LEIIVNSHTFAAKNIFGDEKENSSDSNDMLFDDALKAKSKRR
jgi:hypothetical protein